jgi:hypothetical protein
MSVVGNAPNIKVVEGDEELFYQYLYRSNCFISLHHEHANCNALSHAMFLGREIVATTAGASAHYLNEENSFPIAASAGIDVIKEASAALQKIGSDTGVVLSKGRKAQQFAEKFLSKESVGFDMQMRIADLDQLRVEGVKRPWRLRRRHSLARRGVFDDHHTEAVIKILLSKVARPAILE